MGHSMYLTLRSLLDLKLVLDLEAEVDPEECQNYQAWPIEN